MKKKNKFSRILALILAVITVLGIVLTPIIVNAEGEDTAVSTSETTSENASDTDKSADATDTKNDTKSDDNSEWSGLCSLSIYVPDSITDKTDNIIIRFTRSGAIVTAGSVTLSRKNNFTTDIELSPGKYNIDFVNADNNYEVAFKENNVEVPNAVKAEMSLHIKNIRKGGFFLNFLRNNSVLLIILIVSCIVYYILRKKRENMSANVLSQD